MELVRGVSDHHSNRFVPYLIAVYLLCELFTFSCSFLLALV